MLIATAPTMDRIHRRTAYLDQCGAMWKEEKKDLFGPGTCQASVTSAPDVLRKVLKLETNCNKTNETCKENDAFLCEDGLFLLEDGETVDGSSVDSGGFPGTPCDTPPLGWTPESVIELLQSMRNRPSPLMNPDSASVSSNLLLREPSSPSISTTDTSSRDSGVFIDDVDFSLGTSPPSTSEGLPAPPPIPPPSDPVCVNRGVNQAHKKEESIEGRNKCEDAPTRECGDKDDVFLRKMGGRETQFSPTCYKEENKTNSESTAIMEHNRANSEEAPLSIYQNYPYQRFEHCVSPKNCRLREEKEEEMRKVGVPVPECGEGRAARTSSSTTTGATTITSTITNPGLGKGENSVTALAAAPQSILKGSFSPNSVGARRREALGLPFNELWFPDPKLLSAEEFVLQSLSADAPNEYEQRNIKMVSSCSVESSITLPRSTEKASRGDEDQGQLLPSALFYMSSSFSSVETPPLKETGGIKRLSTSDLAHRYFQAALGVDDVIVAATLKFLDVNEAILAAKVHPDSVDVQTQVVAILSPTAEAIEPVCLAMLRFSDHQTLMDDGVRLLHAFLGQSLKSRPNFSTDEEADTPSYQIGHPNAWRSRWVAKYGGTEALLQMFYPHSMKLDPNCALLENLSAQISQGFALTSLKILARYSKASRSLIFFAITASHTCWEACQVALTMQAAPTAVVEKAMNSLPDSLGALEAISLRSDSSSRLAPYLQSLIDFGSAAIPVLVNCASNANPEIKEMMRKLCISHPGLASTHLNEVLKKSPQCQLFALGKEFIKPQTPREPKRSKKTLCGIGDVTVIEDYFIGESRIEKK